MAAYCLGLLLAEGESTPIASSDALSASAGAETELESNGIVQANEPDVTADSISFLESRLLETDRILSLSPAEIPVEFERLVASEDKAWELASLGAHWAKSDPDAAMQAALQLLDTKYLNSFTAGLFAVWSRQSPLNAYAAYRKHLSDQRVYGASEHVFYGLASIDVKRAFQELDSYSHDYHNLKRNRESGVAEAIAQNYELETALNILGDVSGNSFLKANIIRAWTRTDFEHTKNVISGKIASADSEAERLVVPFIQSGLAYHENELTAWVRRQDAINGTYSLTRELGYEWLRKDRAAALEWLNQLPNDARRASRFNLLQIEGDGLK
ncbi:MAG: hypothetical protein AAF546_09310 [Verrucomicrobiota bacterium]